MDLSRRILILTLGAALVIAGVGVLDTQPVAAQQAVWIAEFFNNDSLSGTPVGVASFGELGVDWGTSAPIFGMPDDHYSVRFTTDVYLTAGTYRFYALADDAVRLWINNPGSPQLDTFGSPQPGQMLTVDVTLATGYHHFQLDFRENVGLAYVFLKWADLATNPYPPTFPVPQQAPTGSPLWTADYYTNADLQGAPTLTRTEDWPSHNWGSGSPAPSIPNDNFSARYTNTQQYPPGEYDISVRADDGVRVYVDGQLRINEWHLATWGLYSTRLTSTGGAHTIVIEYYEGTELAALEYYFAPATTQPSAPTGAAATVIASRLNVRANPFVAANNVITVISSGETYPVIGRSADGAWWQIQLQGQPGWVSAAWVTVQNAGNVPIADGQAPPATPPPAATGPTLTATANVNIRTGPGIVYQDIGTLRSGASATIIGRTAANDWWQISYQGITGWVINLYVNLGSGVDVTQIPVTG